jgi:5-formyltetrahydrofolate cyclo-ligase
LGVDAIALYRPNDGELDPAQIAATARAGGASTFYPSVDADQMRFVEWDGRGELRRGAFGIEEPESSRHIAPEDLGLVIVPLVGFDQECHRLGMGRGFYDRTFSFVRSAELTARPRLVGVAFDEQRCERIDPEVWDVALDAVVTPTRTFARD